MLINENKNLLTFEVLKKIFKTGHFRVAKSFQHFIGFESSHVLNTSKMSYFKKYQWQFFFNFKWYLLVAAKISLKVRKSTTAISKNWSKFKKMPFLLFLLFCSKKSQIYG